MDDYIKNLLIQLNDSITMSADAHGTSNAPIAKWSSLVTGIIVGQQERINMLEQRLNNVIEHHGLSEGT